MSNNFDKSLIDDYKKTTGDGGSGSIERLKTRFLEDLPSELNGESIFCEIENKFDADEMPEVCAELVLTVTASCGQDDFHNWDYEHLNFIIDLSSEQGFDIPLNLLNGLPPQLLLLVDSDRIDDSGCR